MDAKGFEARYAKLNDRQKQAVNAIDGPVMVIAGPGTGKTELLSMRVANILKQTDALPENILCLTYTESGATAMRKRLIEIIGSDAYKVAIHTFHSFGSEVINQNREFFFNGAEFQPADELVTYEVLNELLAALPLNHPFASTMNGEFTMRSDLAKVIDELKKAGLTPDKLRAILAANQPAIDQAQAVLSEAFGGRMSAGMLPAIRAALEALSTQPQSETLFDIPAWQSLLISSLGTAVAAAEEHPKTTPPLTAWKNAWMTTDKQKQLVLKARERQQKLYLVADMYESYLESMQRRERYDFSDMILQVVSQLEESKDLLYNLQEKYQYFLVDEFQDTNLAQLRIVHLLTDSPINEGRPNVFVVGDPDQAIYSFQGADVSNIVTFAETYPTVETIVLTENYRSTQGILDDSRQIITKSSERMADRTPELNQPLTAATSHISSPQVYSLPSIPDEYAWVAEQVKAHIEQGTKPADIAILMIKHSDLQSLLPHLSAAGIPVTYERKDDVLALEPIIQLIALAQVIDLFASQKIKEANALLPELLSHPAWGFDSQLIWKLSSLSHNNGALWLDTMETISEFALWRSWMLELVAESTHLQLEEMIDRMLGVPDDTKVHPTHTLYEYFFSAEALERQPAQYVECIEGLTSLRQKLSETEHSTTPLRLVDFVSFVALHRRANIKIPLTRQVGNDTAVHIMTAHKSKGLEFDHVYIVGVTENKWRAGGKPPLISYPENLAMLRADTSSDERLRLFYVAMTRAKRSLTISYSVLNPSQKTLLPASFLTDWEAAPIEPVDDRARLTRYALVSWHHRIIEPVQELRDFLAPRLEQYRLNATDFTKFLDLMYGGPHQFLIKSLLKFPGAPTPSSQYGNAIHNTLCYLHTEYLIDQTPPTMKKALPEFEKQLRKQGLEDEAFGQYHEKGIEELTAYLAFHAPAFSTSQKPELNLSGQESQLGEVRLGGRLDLVTINKEDKTISVTDYKTSKPELAWVNSSGQLHKYRQQLMFYKLLLEHSRDYNTYTVTQGVIDFLKPINGQVVSLPLDFQKEEIERFERLVSAVWQHITSLTIPDTSHYSNDLKGTLAFEEDLINGVI